jgi:hypothetical protein
MVLETHLLSTKSGEVALTDHFARSLSLFCCPKHQVSDVSYVFKANYLQWPHWVPAFFVIFAAAAAEQHLEKRLETHYDGM